MYLYNDDTIYEAWDRWGYEIAKTVFSVKMCLVKFSSVMWRLTTLVDTKHNHRRPTHGGQTGDNYCMYHWEQKKRLYHLPKSQNNSTKVFGLIGNSVTHGEIHLGGVRPSWTCLICNVDHSYPPPPHGRPADMWGELYTPSAEEQFLSTQCRCHSLSCDTLVLTTSSSLSSSTSSPFFFLPWVRVSWLLLGCHHARFLTCRGEGK
jgi:hypothetical protein